MTTADTRTGDLPPGVSYLGIAYSGLTLEQAAAALAARPAGAAFAYVVTPNAQHVVHLNRGEPFFTLAYRDAWLRLSDSRVLAALTKLIGGPRLPVATGSDLTALLFQSVITADDPLVVIGGTAETDERLRAMFGLRHLVSHRPPMGVLRNPQAIAACVEFIAAHPARFVFFAVGSPQSEVIAQHAFASGRATGSGLCIGGALLFLTGQVKRAPLWMRRLALEWLYRLLANPRGHFRRVFVDSLPLVGLVLADRFKTRRSAK
ncbi:WecB/TagA/CpsF family glycosyltransferase [Rhodospirillum rubrum]|uniref:Glycosyl transferase WecB/TagA/CpsF n=1 Tax=Rhodospirillum rubrum (strain ATCC 11170 / ATH 1.1.1 / DSM 467 / LMG 4362 / NCIMB 8255 / S1) TaxID=269796 RepID=Q2RMY4_RHORT|nr:WecB/TagA/CpsF family glycosyltransferase [Rhodospirillum rubrum]ABC24511.1 Glycosyl transferase WecB/TagA/CpsF [Rhodospirillum rubrum ATCC 11170]MBK5956237.1 glycosyltransferase [Rhodospirillum rubrum]QXG80428.1 WecB/TagA/CpsF family glycosyltransferase [Rhodospirillum rubrum]HAP99726.1 glycosyltransferase [Rhodospirillum rubrum]HCF17473.1 glycosyltransferase [Rhodospirillum rubrum]